MKAAGSGLQGRKRRLREMNLTQDMCLSMVLSWSKSRSIRLSSPHFPSLTESWVQILVFPPNKEQNVDRTWREKESSTHDYRVGKKDLKSHSLCYRNPKILFFLSPNWLLRCWWGTIIRWEDREGQTLVQNPGEQSLLHSFRWDEGKRRRDWLAMGCFYIRYMDGRLTVRVPSQLNVLIKCRWFL